MRALNRNTALLRTVQASYLHSKGCAGADAVPQLPHSLPPLLQFSSQGTNNRTCFWEERVRAWINGCATEVFVSTRSFLFSCLVFASFLTFWHRGAYGDVLSIWLLLTVNSRRRQTWPHLHSLRREVELLTERQLKCLFWSVRGNRVRSEYDEVNTRSVFCLKYLCYACI